MKRATMSPTFFDSIFQNKFSTYIRIGIHLISIKDYPLGILQSSKVKKATSGKWFNLMIFSFKRVVQPPTRYGKLSSSFCKMPQISHGFFRRYICEPYLGHTEIRKSLKKSTDWYRECSVFQDTRSWWNVRTRFMSTCSPCGGKWSFPWTSRHFLCFQFKNIHSLETKRQ